MEKSKTDSSRREFLGRTAIVTGGMALALQGIVLGDEAVKEDNTATKDDVVLKLKDHDALKKPGGFEVVDTDAGKVIVACTDADTYVACSAICTHKNGILRYEHDARQFVCPKHGARFDLDGAVAQGPAQRDLRSYSTDSGRRHRDQAQTVISL